MTAATSPEKPLSGYSLAELVSEIPAQFWQDPFIKYMIEGGAEPKALDAYLLSLGWPGQLCAQVRRAAQLRATNEPVWQTLTSHSDFPCQHLDFREADFLGFKQFRVSHGFRLGTFTSDRSNWPLFCNEFQVLSTPHGEITSLDETGYGLIHNRQLLTLDEIHEHFDWSTHFESQDYSGTREWARFSHKSNRPSVRFAWDYKCYPLWLTSFVSWQRNGLLPELWKHILLEEEYSGCIEKSAGPGWDRIQLSLRIDIGPAIQSREYPVEVGKVTFTRSIPFYHGPNNRGLQVEMAASFTVTPDLCLAFDPQGSQAVIEVKAGPYTSGIKANGHWRQVKEPFSAEHCTPDVLKVIPDLLQLSENIRQRQETGRPVTLNDLFGVEITTNGPTRLADLFV